MGPWGAAGAAAGSGGDGDLTAEERAAVRAHDAALRTEAAAAAAAAAERVRVALAAAGGGAAGAGAADVATRPRTKEGVAALNRARAEAAGIAPVGGAGPGATAAADGVDAGPSAAAASGAAAAAHPLAAHRSVLGPASPIPTPCVVVKGLFDPAEEAASWAAEHPGSAAAPDPAAAAGSAPSVPPWAVEIGDDVRAECAESYGPVMHCWVDSTDPAGCAYLRFGSAAAASRAVDGLRGRVFGGRALWAEHAFEATYRARWGEDN